MFRSALRPTRELVSCYPEAFRITLGLLREMARDREEALTYRVFATILLMAGPIGLATMAVEAIALLAR